MGPLPALHEELVARYREIDGLLGASRRSHEFRHWQASTVELLRKVLGFHPAVVQFQGLRFRAGPVAAATAEELQAIPVAEHDARMRQDLAEAKRLLRRALAELHIDADAAAAPVARADPLVAALDALDAPTAALAGPAAASLRAALADPHPAWPAVAAALASLLPCGLAVGRAAVSAVAARLPEMR